MDDQLLIELAGAAATAALATLHAVETGAPLDAVLRLGRKATRAFRRLRAVQREVPAGNAPASAGRPPTLTVSLGPDSGRMEP